MMRKTIVIIMALLMVGSVVAWDSNPTFNPFEVIWNAINGMDSTPDTIADDNIISANEVDQSQIQLRVAGNCAVGSSIRAISPDGSVTCEPDDTGITSETDPQVASTTSGKWCRGTGTQVTCDQNAPVIPEIIELAGTTGAGCGTWLNFPSGLTASNVRILSIEILDSTNPRWVGLGSAYSCNGGNPIPITYQLRTDSNAIYFGHGDVLKGQPYRITLLKVN